MDEKRLQRVKTFADNRNFDLSAALTNLIGNVQSEAVGRQYVPKDESYKSGKKIRKEVSLEEHGKWDVSHDRDEAIKLLIEQEKTRVQELIPLRHERMSASPFTFYRGAAAIMAYDLSNTPTTNITVQAVGDAHIGNFGVFASPERRLVFDINDFDETLPGPWEWDVKRLMASIEICGRDRGFSAKKRHKAVKQAAAAYRRAMLHFSEMGNLDVWYAHVDMEDLFSLYGDDIDEKELKDIRKATEKAISKNSTKAVTKLTELVDGHYLIKSDAPVIVPLRDLYKGDESDEVLDNFIRRLLTIYRLTLPRERRDIISRYRAVDAARKVVGVGSVGTKAWIVVLEGVPGGDPLVLQIKEAQESVLEKYVEKSRFAEHGRRVVEGQKAIQTASDILLGWICVPSESGYDHYYVRQLWDAKGSVDLTKISEDGLVGVASLCAWTLAHAHAKTGDRHAIAGYLGKSKDFEKAMVEFADSYADQNEIDYKLFMKNIATSTIS